MEGAAGLRKLAPGRTRERKKTRGRSRRGPKIASAELMGYPKKEQKKVFAHSKVSVDLMFSVKRTPVRKGKPGKKASVPNYRKSKSR